MAMYQWSTFKDFHIHCMVTACSTHSTFAAPIFISYSTFGQSEVKCVGCQWALQRECSGQNQPSNASKITFNMIAFNMIALFTADKEFSVL